MDGQGLVLVACTFLEVFLVFFVCDADFDFRGGCLLDVAELMGVT